MKAFLQLLHFIATLCSKCIIRVEDSLFKVSFPSEILTLLKTHSLQIHKYILTRDSPIFVSLFGSHQGSLTVKGLSDSLPIILEGDRANDIRSLLKYLYAPYVCLFLDLLVATLQNTRAYEVQTHNISVTETDNILAVARLAHKYDMPSWQNWALVVILQFLIKNNTSLSSAEYGAIYDLSYMLSALVLRDSTSKMWLNMITGGGLPISDALDAAESNGDRPFHTLLYAHELRGVGVDRLPRNTSDALGGNAEGLKSGDQSVLYI
ncbi:hypothetical protein B0H13DRAFT_2330253 [Mycena leptocephala]|nr:hypothetical protein B0H13DRAFT_2330253 [Mycena leptocephala]